MLTYVRMLRCLFVSISSASNVVFLSVLLVFSAVAALGQALFQTVLATHYSEELYPCKQSCFLLCHEHECMCKMSIIKAVDSISRHEPDSP